MGQNHVASLTWRDVERRLRSGASALLPVGAGAKEHGLHLPMNTDEIQALWLADRLAERFDMLIWPALTYGHYPAFAAFPGSISLSRRVFSEMASEIIQGILAHSPQALFVLNTGISTLEPLDDALARIRSGIPVVHQRIHDGMRYRKAAASLSEQEFGSHADELETSRMLVVAPSVVDMTKAEKSPRGPFKGPLTLDNAPAGTYGDPTLASAGKGEVLLGAMLDDLFEAASRCAAAR